MAKSDSSDTPRARGKPAAGWEERFLTALAVTGIVKRACDLAGVSRSTVYAHRENDEAFAAAWRDAEEDSADLAELEAWRRGVEGVEKPVFYKGEEVATIREYSERMLEILLKARRPEKFRDNVKLEHGGSVVLTLSDLIRRAREKPKGE